jgi:outer membrane protein assembly factor BamB
MRTKPYLLTFFFLALASLLSACAGGGAGIATSWPGLTFVEDTAYLAYNTQVYAIDVATGREIWHFPLEVNRNMTFYADPALSPDGQVIVGGYDTNLYSLNPLTGAETWKFEGAQKRYIGSPLVVEQGIFAPNADKKLYALDLNGNLRWTFTTQGELWAQPITNEECECIYLPSMDHHIYALNPEDGKMMWESEDLGGAIVGIPALDENGVLYVGTLGSEVIALDTQDQSILWRKPTVGWVWSGLTLAGETLYIGDLKGYFYAFDRSSGNMLWQLTPEQLDGPIPGSPVVTEDAIYLTSEAGTLYQVDLQGKILPPNTIGGKLYAPPVLANDLILVTPINSEQFLVALTKEGARRWSFPPAQQ